MNAREVLPDPKTPGLLLVDYLAHLSTRLQRYAERTEKLDVKERKQLLECIPAVEKAGRLLNDACLLAEVTESEELRAKCRDNVECAVSNVARLLRDLLEMGAVGCGIIDVGLVLLAQKAASLQAPGRLC